MGKKIVNGREKVYHFPWKVSYYETDAMKIVHHSNYFRWMESARCAYLEWAGTSYQSFEAEGIASPVMGVEASYKKPAVFADEVDVAVCMASYDGLRFEFWYRITRAGELLCEGKSRHCFTQAEDGRVISLIRTRPDLHSRIVAFLEDEADDAAEGRSTDCRAQVSAEDS